MSTNRVEALGVGSPGESSFALAQSRRPSAERPNHSRWRRNPHLPEAGALIWRDKPAVRNDVQRICSMWCGLLQEHGDPLLFGSFSVADAFFAPVCMRLKTYALPVPDRIRSYVDRVCTQPDVQAWITDALAEHDF